MFFFNNVGKFAITLTAFVQIGRALVHLIEEWLGYLPNFDILRLKCNSTFGVNLTLILELKSNPYSGVI
jgi:hypothetical protein